MGVKPKKEEPRGKIIADIIQKYYQSNNLTGFKEELKEKLGIDELNAKIVQQLKLNYVDYALEVGLKIEKFPALISAGKKEVKWNSKALVISTRLVPADLLKAAMDNDIKYEITMEKDYTVIAKPIK